MSDPAIEAAQRADEANDGWPWDTTRGAMVEAAREALKPIRELHKREGGGTPTGEYADMCYECQDYWPCATAKRIYPSEELLQ